MRSRKGRERERETNLKKIVLFYSRIIECFIKRTSERADERPHSQSKPVPDIINELFMARRNRTHIKCWKRNENQTIETDAINKMSSVLSIRG